MNQDQHHSFHDGDDDSLDALHRADGEREYSDTASYHPSGYVTVYVDDLDLDEVEQCAVLVERVRREIG